MTIVLCDVMSCSLLDWY